MSQLSADQAMIQLLVMQNVPEETCLAYDSQTGLKIPTGSVHIYQFDLASLSCVGWGGVMMYYCEQSEHFKR